MQGHSCFLLQGTCNKGSHCEFLHADVDPDAPFCTAYQQGFCALGQQCPHQHFDEEFYMAHPRKYDAMVANAWRRKKVSELKPPGPIHMVHPAAAELAQGGLEGAQPGSDREVPHLLRDLPNPQVPGTSDPVLYHIAGVLVYAEPEALDLS